MNNILNNDSDFSKVLENSKKPLIIIGTSAINNEDGEEIIKICAEISSKYGLFDENFNGLNILQQNISRVGALDIGFYNNKFDKNWTFKIKEEIEKNKPVVFLLGLDDIDLSILKKSFCCLYRSSWRLWSPYRRYNFTCPSFSRKKNLYFCKYGRTSFANNKMFSSYW